MQCLLVAPSYFADRAAMASQTNSIGLKAAPNDEAALKMEIEQDKSGANGGLQTKSNERNTHASFTCGKALIWKNKHDFPKI
jgi:hypothetical protein